MTDENLKQLMESLSSEIDDYIELVVVKKSLMTQKTYSMRREQHAAAIGEAIAHMIEERIRAGTSKSKAGELGIEEPQMREMGYRLIEFIDARIDQGPGGVQKSGA